MIAKGDLQKVLDAYERGFHDGQRRQLEEIYILVERATPCTSIELLRVLENKIKQVRGEEDE